MIIIISPYHCGYGMCPVGAATYRMCPVGAATSEMDLALFTRLAEARKVKLYLVE